MVQYWRVPSFPDAPRDQKSSDNTAIDSTLQSIPTVKMAPSAIDAPESKIGPASGPEVILEPEVSTTPTAPRLQPRHEEYQYLDLIRQIIDEGEHRPDR